MKKLVPIAVVCLAVAMWVGGNSFAAHSDRGCNNCHVPHWAAPESETDYGVPLWSPVQLADFPTTGLKFTYTMYSSKGFDALNPVKSAQPDGPSKLCLGCHDGSYSRWSSATANPHTKFEASDLARSHPISFVYDSALATRSGGRLKDPAVALSNLPGGGTIQKDLLDSKDKMQCTSCHDVHTSGVQEQMLRYSWLTADVIDPVTGTRLQAKNDHIMCRVCHNK